MENALKKTSQFLTEDEEQNSASVLKKKRTWFALLFVLLGVVAVAFFFNQKEAGEPEITASSENTSEAPVAPSAKEQSAKPLPTQTEPKPTKPASKSEQTQNESASGESSRSAKPSEKKALTFKQDANYLAMNRYEWPSLESKPPVAIGEHVRKTATAVDKPLIFAGKGFEIQGFQSLASQVVRADFLQHLNRPAPKVKPVRLERLDLQLIQAKSSRQLIFHPLGSALSQFQKPAPWETPHSRNNPQDLKPVPETKLLFGENKRSELILRPGSESLDLLIGNEKINRKEFGSW
jgi:hypothetical protein